MENKKWWESEEIKNPNEEHILQSACFLWYHNSYLSKINRKRLFMVNNNAYNRQEGNKYKSLGVVPGVTDTIFVAPHEMTFYLEFKKPKGGVHSDDQKDFRDMCIQSGHTYITMKDKEQFKKFIHGILGAPDVEIPL